MEATKTISVTLGAELHRKIKSRALEKGFSDLAEYLADLCDEDTQFSPEAYEKVKMLLMSVKGAQ